MSQNPLGPELFSFFRDLADNNRREWFQANKERFERDVQEPALRFISDFGPYLREISPNFQALPKKVGGSLFRIYRDVRFGKDKRPYKTNLAMRFTHKLGKDVHAPGYYLHLEPGAVFAGVGIWHPESSVLRSVREAIVQRPVDWRKAVEDPGFVEHYERGGDSLKRAPRGFDPEHPLVDDLKRKDHAAFVQLAESEALEPDFAARLAERYSAANPYLKFLCQAVDVPF